MDISVCHRQRGQQQTSSLISLIFSRCRPIFFILKLSFPKQCMTINHLPSAKFANLPELLTPASHFLCRPSPVLSLSLQAGQVSSKIYSLSLIWRLCQVRSLRCMSASLPGIFQLFYCLLMFLIPTDQIKRSLTNKCTFTCQKFD